MIRKNKHVHNILFTFFSFCLNRFPLGFLVSRDVELLVFKTHQAFIFCNCAFHMRE